MSVMRQIERRIAGHVAAVELRSLLVADAAIALERRLRLIQTVAVLIEDPQCAHKFEKRLTILIQRRFGRNPDNFQVSAATRQALHLLHAAQRGTCRYSR